MNNRSFENDEPEEDDNFANGSRNLPTISGTPRHNEQSPLADQLSTYFSDEKVLIPEDDKVLIISELSPIHQNLK